MKLLYFAWVREKIGTGEEMREIPAGVTSIAQVLDWLETLGPNYKAALARRELLRAAINGEAVPFDAPVRARDEVAIFPPVTGG